VDSINENDVNSALVNSSLAGYSSGLPHPSSYGHSSLAIPYATTTLVGGVNRGIVPNPHHPTIGSGGIPNPQSYMIQPSSNDNSQRREVTGMKNHCPGGTGQLINYWILNLLFNFNS